jgi:hypothetical protein
MSSQTEQSYRVVCMDCPAVMQEGTPGAPVSHGLCRTCFERRMAALDAEKTAEKKGC